MATMPEQLLTQCNCMDPMDEDKVEDALDVIEPPPTALGSRDH